VEIAEVLLLVQILANAGNAAVDVEKLIAAAKARGDTKLNASESAAVQAHIQSHVEALRSAADAFDAAHDASESPNGG
jgi:hypothetical protein